ncbi:hypothetical protein [Streptomyces sp. NBC_01237]|uniref:hypothetical protein n=1 Tax=Streptomyces sp. NBC_01237 TaxID=2903790 RepID=UPI002DDC1CD0|nr:hypothetical protein [Streptomyces sp. NBC_01237]WRZ77299.1 hypothetical protein OG251_37240 [Streptomyces sp. NBC_01237]
MVQDVPDHVGAGRRGCGTGGGGTKLNHAEVEAAGSYFQISKNKSVKWSGAVSAFGVSLGGSTSYDKDHRQRITAGNLKHMKHYIWGAKDGASGKPGVFCSY